MSIAFTKSDWERVKENAEKWWNGELGRPLVHIVTGGNDPGRPEPSTPNYGFTSHYGLTTPAADIIDRWDYNLSCWRYLGDAFPTIFPNFGPGIAAGFLGADVVNGNETTWFHPKEDVEISDLEFRYDPDNPWLRQVCEVYRAAVERWNGMVQVGMTDLGGNLDILSSFRPSEKLLYDLYDYPDAVKQKTWDAHDMWWKYFEQINGILQPSNPGYTAWASILSSSPYYMLQCDFCYMIGPDMFDEFVKPELVASCRKLPHAFYHLDGPGQLPHLDSLLAIEELNGIQWVPGAGVPGWEAWPEVYRKIRDAGKLIQIYGNLDTLAAVMDHTDGYDKIVVLGWGMSESDAREFEERYGRG